MWTVFVWHSLCTNGVHIHLPLPWIEHNVSKYSIPCSGIEGWEVVHIHISLCTTQCVLVHVFEVQLPSTVHYGRCAVHTVHMHLTFPCVQHNVKYISMKYSPHPPFGGVHIHLALPALLDRLARIPACLTLISQSSKDRFFHLCTTQYVICWKYSLHRSPY